MVSSLDSRVEDSFARPPLFVLIGARLKPSMMSSGFTVG